MAITQNPDANSNSKQKVEEAMPKSELTRKRKMGGDPNRCSNKGGIIGKEGLSSFVRAKTYKPSKIRKKDDQDSLSDIDDAEVVGYINTKETLNCKRILWEALNRNYTQAKKQKRTETKKCTPVKKAAKATEKVEIRKTSTKINYDALKLLGDDFNQGSETVHRSEDSPSENISPHGSDDDCYNDDQHDISYGGAFDDSGYGYEDEYENDESFDF